MADLTTLKPCPFCGFQLDRDEADCIYPAVRPEYDEDQDKMVYRVWELNCYEVGGGCGASMLGDSAEDCITKWNTRVVSKKTQTDLFLEGYDFS